MLNVKELFIIALLSIDVLGAFPSMAMKVSSLDLEGNGCFKPVKLPFNYYKREENDCLTLIHQGGYKVYDIEKNKNDVAVIGFLRPCIGVAVTDGKNLVTFHKHSTSSLESMKNVLMNNLNMLDKENLYARIYTTKDDLEWNQNKRQLMHGGKTHLEEVKGIKDFLESIEIIRAQIPANLYSLKAGGYEEYALGRYELAECYVAVRLNDIFESLENGKKQIQFSSIDPYTEDVFGYQGTQITVAESLGLDLPQAQQAYPEVDFTKMIMSYDEIPQLWQQESGEKNGYQKQRGICERRKDREENNLYLTYFGKIGEQLFTVEKENQIGKSYNVLDFFPIN